MNHVQDQIRNQGKYLAWLTANGYLDYPIVVDFETYAVQCRPDLPGCEVGTVIV